MIIYETVKPSLVPKMVMCLKASLRRLDKYKDAKFIAEAQELLTELEEK